MLLPETIALHDVDRFEFSVGYFLPWKDQLVEEIEAKRVKVACFNKSNNLKILASVNLISQYVKDNNIDLIHAHLPWAGFVARLAGKKVGVPVLYTEHNKQERYHLATKWLNKMTFNLQDVGIAVSEDVATSIRGNINPRIPVQTILNGVNTAKFDSTNYDKREIRQKFGIPDNAVVFGTVAVFRVQKRLVKWVELAAKIKEQIPNAFFVMLGDGPEEEDISLKLEAERLNESVLMPGRLEEVRPWLVAMDVYMMTSEFEGLPIALLEAMSMALPVVSTDAGGIKEVIRDGEEGYLAPVDNPDKLLEPTLVLARDEEKRKEMGKKSRERVKDAFSLTRMVRELEEVYLEVLANRGTV